MPNAFVTIVICTFNRPTWLDLCLASLKDELEDSPGVDVLVVDNGKGDATQAVVAGFLANMANLRCVREVRRGLSYARNRGLREAKTELVAFLDDDARVLPGYEERLRKLSSENRFDIVGGIYRPWYAEGKQTWFRDTYASNIGLASEAGELPHDRFASGGIMLVRKAAALNVDAFDPALGMGGQKIGYGEETRLQIEIRRAGGRVGVDPAWQIEHLVPRAKQRVGWLLRRSWAVGRDSWQTFGRTPDAIRLLGLFRRLFTRPAVSFYRELAGRNGSRYWQNLLLSICAPIAQTLGELMAGARGMLRRV